MEHVRSPNVGWFPFVYIAFDSETIDVREPWMLLNSASEQLEAQALPGSIEPTPRKEVDAAFAAFRIAVGQYRDRRAKGISRTADVVSQGVRFDRASEAEAERSS